MGGVAFKNCVSLGDCFLAICPSLTVINLAHMDRCTSVGMNFAAVDPAATVTAAAAFDPFRHLDDDGSSYLPQRGVAGVGFDDASGVTILVSVSMRDVDAVKKRLPHLSSSFRK